MFKYVAIACLLFLSACGFQLRGLESFDLSQESIYLKANNTALSAVLVNTLEDNNAVLIDDSNTADTVIEISRQRFSQTPSAYDANANIIEYALTLTLEFFIDEQLLQFNGTENYAYSETQVLAAENNRNLAEENLTAQAARYIVNSLSN